MKRTRTLILTLAVAGLFASPALAARANHAQVLVDGKVIWDTIITSRGNTPIEEVWPRIADRVVELEAGAPDAGSAKSLALKGKVTVRIMHVDRVLGQADLESLALLRHDTTKNAWYIPVSEMRRAAKAAGIKIDD